jgi:hypothetical protein
MCLWVVSLLVSSWLFGVVLLGFVFFFLAGCVLEVFWFQGLEKSLRLSGTFVVQLLLPLA